MGRAQAAQQVIYNPDPLWLQWAEVITAAILLAVAGILGFVVWVRIRQDKKAQRSEIQERVKKVQARGSPGDRVSDKLSVRQIQDRLRQETANDPAHSPSVTRARPGKHALRSEDDFPTVRIPAYVDPEQTEPIAKLVRPYLDVQPTWNDQPGNGSR